MPIPGEELRGTASRANPDGPLDSIRRAVSPGELRTFAALLAMPEGDALDLLKEIGEVQCWLEPAVSELAKLSLDQWQAEHTRLFVSGHPKTPCPPFESAYRHGHMNGSSVAELEALYAQAGLAALQTSADYLGVILEFAAFLDESGGESAIAAELWQEHMVRWVPKFGRDLECHARLRLYRDLGSRLCALFAISTDPEETGAVDG